MARLGPESGHYLPDPLTRAARRAAQLLVTHIALTLLDQVKAAVRARFKNY